MTTIGTSLTIKGEVVSHEDVTIHGNVNGRSRCTAARCWSRQVRTFRPKRTSTSCNPRHVLRRHCGDRAGRAANTAQVNGTLFAGDRRPRRSRLQRDDRGQSASARDKQELAALGPRTAVLPAQRGRILGVESTTSRFLLVAVPSSPTPGYTETSTRDARPSVRFASDPLAVDRRGEVDSPCT